MAFSAGRTAQLYAENERYNSTQIIRMVANSENSTTVLAHSRLKATSRHRNHAVIHKRRESPNDSLGLYQYVPQHLFNNLYTWIGGHTGSSTILGPNGFCITAT